MVWDSHFGLSAVDVEGARKRSTERIRGLGTMPDGVRNEEMKNYLACMKED